MPAVSKDSKEGNLDDDDVLHHPVFLVMPFALFVVVMLVINMLKLQLTS